jgi:hypothetical protein
MSEPPKTALLDTVRLPRFGPQNKDASGGPYAGGGGRYMKNGSKSSTLTQANCFATREEAKLCLDHNTVFRDA